MTRSVLTRRAALVGGAAFVLLPTRAQAAREIGVSLAKMRVTPPGAVITVELSRPRGTLSAPVVLTWVRRAAAMVTDYFGRFSVPTLKVELRPQSGRRVGFGQHFGGRRLEINVGRQTPTSALERDWVLVHEMLHTAYPRLARRHRWMREGLSTYLESIVRAEAGVVSANEVWRRFVDKMPFGLPDRGDRGLDHTRSWGSVYWGGALFWLLADVRIRAATKNEKSLKDALRLILAEGGNGRKVWSTDRAIQVGDRATGTSVLRSLYAEMAERPIRLDLDELWAQLGVKRAQGGVRLDDGAPLARLRRSMTTRTHQLPEMEG